MWVPIRGLFLFGLVVFQAWGQEAWRSDWVAFRDALAACFSNSVSCRLSPSETFSGTVNWSGSYAGADNCPLVAVANGMTAPCFRVQMPQTNSFLGGSAFYTLSTTLSVYPKTLTEWQGLSAGAPVRFSASLLGILSGPGLSPSITVGVGQAALGAAAPQISSVVNGATFAPGISPQSWITIRGSSLSATTRTWRDSDFSGNKLPMALDDVRVQVNGRDAAVYYISPTQINALAPADDATGAVTVSVTNPQGRVETASTLQKYSPAFFDQPITGPITLTKR